MKTHAADAEPERSVTMTMNTAEAIMLWQALECFRHAYRGVPSELQSGRRDTRKRWGHWDCPPNLNPLFALISASLADEVPEHYEMFFGHPPDEHTGKRDFPLPNSVASSVSKA